jgi:predicted MFS family arabinose efflux permease
VRRLVVTVYALLFFGEVAWTAIVPLLPAYTEELGLSRLEAAALLTSSTVALLVVSLPAGQIADRFGARRPTLVGAALMVIAVLWNGLADGFWDLLAARALVGATFGFTWTTGAAWLTAIVAPERRSSALAGTITMAGLGGVVGPALAGLVAPPFGNGAPFLVAAAPTAVAAAVLVALARRPVDARPGPAVGSLRAVLALALRDERLRASVVLMTLGGAVGGAMHLLVPFALRGEGFSTAGIGAVFTVASVAFIATSTIVARKAARLAHLGLAAALVAVIAADLVVLGIGGAVLTIAGAIVLRGLLVAALYTIAFPIGLAGGEGVGVGAGAVAGLANMAFAVSAVAGPIVAGAGEQAAGARATYAGFALLSAAAAAALLWPRLAPARQASSASSRRPAASP